MASTEQPHGDRREAAMAQLALQLRQGSDSRIAGAEPSDEELAALYENRLDNTRRAQILSYIAHSPAVYQRWIRCVEALAFMEEIATTKSVENTFAKTATPGALPQSEPASGFFAKLFGNPTAVFGGGLATAFIIVLGVYLTTVMESEFDLKGGIDGIYQGWGGGLGSEWAALPESARPTPRLAERGFFSKPKSDLQKVLETGFQTGMAIIGKQPLIELGIDVDNLTAVNQTDIRSLTEEQFDAVMETGRLVAATAVLCHINARSERLAEALPPVDYLIKQFAALPASDKERLLNDITPESGVATVCQLSANVLGLLGAK